MSIGKPKYMSIPTSIQAAAMVVAIYPVATLFGITGVCVLTTSLSLGVLVYFAVVFSRIFRARFIEIVSPMAPSLVSGFVMYSVLVVLVLFVQKDVLWLVTLSAFGTVLYVVVLHFVSGGRDVRDFIALFKRSFGGRQDI
jgi:O-antigen/teichoic acid export membrane protein